MHNSKQGRRRKRERRMHLQLQRPFSKSQAASAPRGKCKGRSGEARRYIGTRATADVSESRCGVGDGESSRVSAQAAVYAEDRGAETAGELLCLLECSREEQGEFSEAHSHLDKQGTVAAIRKDRDREVHATWQARRYADVQVNSSEEQGARSTGYGVAECMSSDERLEEQQDKGAAQRIMREGERHKRMRVGRGYDGRSSVNETCENAPSAVPGAFGAHYSDGTAMEVYERRQMQDDARGNQNAHRHKATEGQESGSRREAGAVQGSAARREAKVGDEGSFGESAPSAIPGAFGAQHKGSKVGAGMRVKRRTQERVGKDLNRRSRQEGIGEEQRGDSRRRQGAQEARRRAWQEIMRDQGWGCAAGDRGRLC